jgi:GT2 family glycosyltransferase
LLLNSDARVLAGAVRALLACAEAHPRSAVVGGLIRNEDGSFQASFSDFPSMAQELLMLTGLGRLLYGPWYPSHGAQEQGGALRVAWVSGAAMLVRRAAMGEIGGFDERYFMYAEEMDLCCRCIRAGWEVWYEPAAIIHHLGGASSRTQPAQREIQLYSSRVRFYGTHSGVWHARTAAALIVAITALKRPAHALVRRLSGGRRGRTVAPPIALWTQLRKQL